MKNTKKKSFQGWDLWIDIWKFIEHFRWFELENLFQCELEKVLKELHQKKNTKILMVDYSFVESQESKNQDQI